MSTLELFERTQFERTPFDILFRNFFQDQGQYVPMVEKNKVSHPVDLYETEKGLNFDIACTGISKDEIDIQLNGDILKVNYDRIEDDNKDYIYWIREAIILKSDAKKAYGFSGDNVIINLRDVFYIEF